MAKVKYTYDSKTLSYKKIDRNWKVRLKEVTIFGLVSMAFGFVFYMAADRIFLNVAHKWAYISIAGGRVSGSDSYLDEVRTFDRDMYPEMVINE